MAYLSANNAKDYKIPEASMARYRTCGDRHPLYGKPQGRGFLCSAHLSGCIFDSVIYCFAFRVLPSGSVHCRFCCCFHPDNSPDLPQATGGPYLSVEVGDYPVMGVCVGIPGLVPELFPLINHCKG